MTVAAIIPAAGSGVRMGAHIPKPYLMLAGKPILAHTLAVFETVAEVSEITLVVHPDEMDSCRAKVLSPYGFKKVLRLVPGGRERQDSVFNALKILHEDERLQYILVHDGVRPLIRPEDIRGVIQAAMRHGAAILACPAQDTLKRVNAKGEVLETIDRRQIWQSQTPQVFRLPLLWRAFVEAYGRGFYGTDEAALVEALPHPVMVVPGSPFNLKITTQEDLRLAEALLAHRGKEA